MGIMSLINAETGPDPDKSPKGITDFRPRQTRSAAVLRAPGAAIRTPTKDSFSAVPA
jgi:hypothetical protein